MIEKKQIEACIERVVERFLPCEPEASCSFQEPASDKEISVVESKFDVVIPDPVRDSLKSNSFYVTWDLCEPDDCPKIFEDACEGMLYWNLSTVKDYELRRKRFTEKTLQSSRHLRITGAIHLQLPISLQYTTSNRTTRFSRLIFLRTRNSGNYFGFVPKIELHGATLASSLNEFFDQMCSLAFLALTQMRFQS